MIESRSAADHARGRLTLWVAREIMPHEPQIRGWLRQQGASAEDIDDLIQETYAKIAGLSDPREIAQPRAYFFQVVRHLRIDQVRRSKVVRIDSVGEIEAFGDRHEALHPEKIVSDRHALSRVLRLIDALPPRCGEIVRMRKIDGLSQREIARRLGVSESVVENDVGKGLALVLQAMRLEDAPFDTRRSKRR